MALYCQIAAAFRAAAIELGIPIRWGGCWKALRSLPADADGIEREVELYAQTCRAKYRRALIDGPHFELPSRSYPA